MPLAFGLMDYDVSVIGLGRVGLPLAICFADRGLRVLGIDNDPERTAAVRDGRMPFEETGMQEVLDRVHAAGTLDVSDRARRRRARASTSSSRSARRRSATSRSTCADIRVGARRPAARPERGPHAVAALDDRARARPSSSPATWRSTAASRSARTSSSPTRPSGSPPGASSRRSARCRASSAASASAPARSSASCSASSARRIVQTTPVQAELAKIWTNILRYTISRCPTC